MTLPNFFIVGAPKCGTSGLYHFLRAHPQIFMAKPKELNFFCKDLSSPEFLEDSVRYRSLFENAADFERIGEASVWYLFSKVAAQGIHDSVPDAKIIALVRNPVDMCYSYHSQRLWNGTEHIEEFSAAIEAIPDRLASRNLPDKPFPIESLDYIDIARYPGQLRRYLELFPAENVCVIVFDDLKKETQKVYSHVLQFLDVDTSIELRVEDSQLTRNANKNLRSQTLGNLMSNPPSWVKVLGRLTLPSQEARNRMWKRVRRMNIEWRPRKEMDPALRLKLEEIFKEDIRELSTMLDRDLVELWLNK